MKNIILQLDNVSFAAKDKNLLQPKIKSILKDISFSFERGKIYGLTGESGSGKTTLAKLITGVIKDYSGKVTFNYKNNWNNVLSSPVQMLFQNDGYLINPERKIKDIFNETYRIRNKSKKNYFNEIENLFSALGLDHKLLSNKGSQLSGGEQQRIALARILIIEPELLILDEPFSSQDIEAKSSLIKLILNTNKQMDTTIICISHDIFTLRVFSDEIIIFSDGKIIESGTTNQIFDNPQIKHTKFLLRAQSLTLSKEEIISHFNDEQNKRNKNS